MAFNVPVQNPLTQAQSEALSKVSALKNILTIPLPKFSTRPKEQQISLLDYLTKIANSTLGAGYIETLMMKWVNELFDKNSQKLEDCIIVALGKSLDAKPITIRQGVDNTKWLNDNVKPELHLAMQILKAYIIKKIIILIYGPSNRMKLFLPLNWPPNSNYYLNFTDNDDLDINQLLDNASLQDVMFTTENTESNSFGDTEYNIVKLRQQLEKGQVVFTISCQDVKISLPETILEEIDNLLEENIANVQGTTINGQLVTYQNPAKVFTSLNGYVENETQRINNEENAAAVSKSWIRILVDKIINLLPIVLYPILKKVLDKVNTEIQSQPPFVNPNLTVENTIGLLVALKNNKSNEQLFSKNSTFYRVMYNALYSLLLAIILKKVIKELTKLIAKALAKKKAGDLLRKFKRLQERAKLLQEQFKEAEKKVVSAKAYKALLPIFNFVQNNGLPPV